MKGRIGGACDNLWGYCWDHMLRKASTQYPRGKEKDSEECADDEGSVALVAASLDPNILERSF